MPLKDVARLMVDFDCGEIPVVEDQAFRPIGVITDRDITIRTVAEGQNPLELTARDCMTVPVVTVTPDTLIEACCRVMEAHRIRRVPVVDEGGSCCGIVSQADLARKVSGGQTAEVVQRVSEETKTPAQPLPSMAADPVCGMRVDPAKAERADYKGVSYFFCSAACRRRFITEPESYAVPAVL